MASTRIYELIDITYYKLTEGEKQIMEKRNREKAEQLFSKSTFKNKYINLLHNRG